MSPHLAAFLVGAEIVANASGSHHELRKLNSRLSLMGNATRKCGGAYVYSNHRGCDGNRLYFDGCASILVNGNLVAQASQFSLKDVEVVSATIDLDEIRSYRGVSCSVQEQSSKQNIFPIIDISHFSLRSELYPSLLKAGTRHSQSSIISTYPHFPFLP
jgi:NAD+ synthase (glutamine-hydrolysing)